MFYPTASDELWEICGQGHMTTFHDFNPGLHATVRSLVNNHDRIMLTININKLEAWPSCSHQRLHECRAAGGWRRAPVWTTAIKCFAVERNSEVSKAFRLETENNWYFILYFLLCKALNSCSRSEINKLGDRSLSISGKTKLEKGTKRN